MLWGEEKPRELSRAGESGGELGTRTGWERGNARTDGVGCKKGRRWRGALW